MPWQKPAKTFRRAGQYTGEGCAASPIGCRIQLVCDVGALSFQKEGRRHDFRRRR